MGLIFGAGALFAMFFQRLNPVCLANLCNMLSRLYQNVKAINVQHHCEHCQERLESVFGDLSPDERNSLNVRKGCSRYRKGQVIFHEGAFPHGLFCVNIGKVKIFQSGDDGKDQIIHFAKAGDILGYRSLLSGERYASSAAAISDCSICFVPKDVFMMLLDKNAGLSRRLLILLSHDLKEAQQKITHIAQKSVRERIAEALLCLKETYGYEKDGTTINVVLTREDIANVAGTTAESAIRQLSEFRHKKIIGLRGKKISFLNLPLLVKTAHPQGSSGVKGFGGFPGNNFGRELLNNETYHVVKETDYSHTL